MEINLGVMENGQRSKEAVQLLRDGHDSSSSDVHYHYQLPPPQTAFSGRKKVYRKHRRKSPSGSISSSGEATIRGKNGMNGRGDASCFPCFPRMSRFVNWMLAFALIIGASALLWVIYGLRLDLVALERRVHDFEAGNQKLPDQLHEYHTKLKSVTENQTVLVAQVVAISDKMTELTQQLTSLSTSVSKLEKGLMRTGGSTDLLSLPDDVAKMQATMASFGSQLRDVTSELASAKNSSGTVSGRVESLEQHVSGLDAAAKNAVNVSAADVAQLNATLQWAVDDLHRHHSSIEELQNSQLALSTLQTSMQNLTEVVQAVSAVADQNAAAVKLVSQKLDACCVSDDLKEQSVAPPVNVPSDAPRTDQTKEKP